MPVLIVSDSTLRAIDYAEAGKRSAPIPIEDTVLYVDRKRQPRSRNGEITYHFLHLHIYTRTGFIVLLNNVMSPTGLLLDKIFGWALKAS